MLGLLFAEMALCYNVVAKSRCSFYHIFDPERDEEEGRCPITNDDDFHKIGSESGQNRVRIRSGGRGLERLGRLCSSSESLEPTELRWPGIRNANRFAE